MLITVCVCVCVLPIYSYIGNRKERTSAVQRKKQMNKQTTRNMLTTKRN